MVEQQQAYRLDENLFNRHLQRENLLREVEKLALKVEKGTDISVVRCNVGKPTGPTLPEAMEFEEAYIKHKRDIAEEFAREGHTKCLRRGYDDHAGDPAQLAAAAEALIKINRLEKGELNNKRLFSVNGGTGGLNVAVSLWENPTVLVPDPYYPPWKPIIARNNGDMVTFPMRKEDDYLLNEGILEEKLKDIPKGKPVVLLYHYPHNPIGKVLTEKEAEKVAGVLSRLVDKFPDLILIQEDLYLGTIRSDKGIYTPLPFLSDKAKQHTLWIHSPSKEGLGMSRAALMATFSDQLAEKIRNSSATFTLGMGSEPLVATVRTLVEIAAGGVDAREGPAYKGQNHRYNTADYYQERMIALGKGFQDLEKALGPEILKDQGGTIMERFEPENPGKPEQNGIPQGTYYLRPSLAFMKGKAVPKEFLDVVGHETIESTGDIKMMLAHAYKIGLRPVTVADGEIFTDDNKEFFIRLAAVDEAVDPKAADKDKKLINLADASNTLKGVIGMVMGKDLQELGVEVRTMDQLQKECPVETDKFTSRLGIGGIGQTSLPLAGG